MFIVNKLSQPVSTVEIKVCAGEIHFPHPSFQSVGATSIPCPGLPIQNQEKENKRLEQLEQVAF
jgi:hypothetical protein